MNNKKFLIYYALIFLVLGYSAFKIMFPDFQIEKKHSSTDEQYQMETQETRPPEYSIFANEDFPAGYDADNKLSTVGETKQSTTTTPTNTAQTTEAVGRRNALRKALNYLDFTAFSYTGLIKQLEYEGFTRDEAIYGADNSGADWNEQAYKKALNYLDFTAFSYTGLIKQLEYEGFSRDEAVYGADNSGADWNEQAYKKGMSYLDLMAFSREGLIDQLEYEGFTEEEIEYALTKIGY